MNTKKRKLLIYIVPLCNMGDKLINVDINYAPKHYVFAGVPKISRINN